LPTVEEKDADIAWFIYDLVLDTSANVFRLQKIETKYVNFKNALDKITTPSPGIIDGFVTTLQEKLDEKRENNPPENHILTDILNVAET
jgi:hypothetical protein